MLGFQTGLADLTLGHVLLICVGLTFIYLAIVKRF